MKMQEIKIGDIVRHRYLMQGTNLVVIGVDNDKLLVRYANQGIFQTQELLLNEVALFAEDEDEFL